MKAKTGRRSGAQAPVQRRAAEARPRPERAPLGGALDPGSLLRLQALAGNQAVGELLGRGGIAVQLQPAACPPAPPPAAPVAPHDDPRFVTVASNVKREAGKQKQHPPASKKVAEAQGAAAGPTNEVAGKAAAAQVDDMSQKKPKGFDKVKFIAAVHKAIEAASPKTMDEVDTFAKSGRAGQIKQQVAGQVAENKDAAAKDIKDANAAPPDTSRATPKQVTPMSPEQPGPPPGPVGATAATPSPLPAEQVSLEHGKCETGQQLAEHNITDETVKKSNEPQFQEAMAAKKEADAHATQAPKQFREQEQQQIGQAKGAATGAATAGLDKMHGDRTGALGHVGGDKDKAKAREETARAKAATDVEAIFNATKKEVNETLQGLDGKVTARFDEGERAAKDAFESHYKAKKDDYFNKRYKGIEGAALWIADRFSYPSGKVNEFIEESKKLYVERMEVVINEVATIVETELTRATNRIQEGRKQIKQYVDTQPKELRQVAQEAAGNVQSKFDDLDQAVNDKSESVVDDLAQKYVAAAQAIDERCNAMREENKGLLDQAKDKITGMVETYEKMKAMLAQLAAKAASVVDQILSDPIGFLGNLVSAVRQGLDLFVGNIGKHLKQGLMGWLLGELADAGITMPESFDLKGILQLVLQVLGLTWTNIRARAVAILGEPIVRMIEQGVEIFQKVAHIFTTLREKGLAGLWEMVQDKIGDLKAQVMDQIQDWVITKVITAGVTWIVSMLNPASAFVKACKAIYDIVMFFVERGSQIVALVNAVLDNLAAIASGNLGAAANLVEQALAKALPIAISFLASLLGLGGISDFIKKTIAAVRAPIFKAVDWVLKTVVAPVAKMAAKAVGWVKGKVKGGVDWLKKRGKAGLDKVKKKFAKVFGRKDERSPEKKRQDLQAGIVEAERLLDVADATPDAIRSGLKGIRKTYTMTSLRLVVDAKGTDKETVHIEGSINPTARSKKALISLLPKRVLAKLKAMGLTESAIAAVVAKSPNANKVQGELFEQLGNVAGRALAAERKVQFFEGSRITSVQFKRLYTDGVLGLRKGPYLHVHTILEAKSGPIAAPKLATDEVPRMKPAEQRERIRYAIDLFRDDNPRWASLSRREIYQRFPRQIDARAEKLPREEPGQARRDIERGAPEEGRMSSTWLLDGRPIRLVISPTMTQILGLLPHDVSGASDAGAIMANGINYAVTNLSVTTGELTVLTAKIVAAAK